MTAVRPWVRGRSGFLLLLGLWLGCAIGCGGEGKSHAEPHGPRFPLGASAPPEIEDLELGMRLEEPAPPFQYEEEVCTECHDEDWETNTERRELSMAHDDMVFHHGEKTRWCLDCHAADNRDMLQLANGTLVPPEKSYLLCGQCHGDKFRDWRAGVHGRRTGQWDGEKTYRLCVHCHDAHSPRFKPITPEPPPIRPEDLR